MELTPDERPIVRRAVAAYEAKKWYKELEPSPVRWTELAAFVIETAEGPTRRDR